MPTVRVGAPACKRSHSSHIAVHKLCRLRTTFVDGHVVLLENKQYFTTLAVEEQELDAENFTIVGRVYIKAMSSTLFEQKQLHTMAVSLLKYPLLKNCDSLRGSSNFHLDHPS
ncbi:hypothetical protein Y032_0047g1511 [Ancylostoma ceylanicum]|uniref:Uncharacterized protein n=1 Tax=Ancylostoma ceylanicum TaxID=53326 RepID=A0A016UCD9_9BILA|nr:hypothetical protein Y032_0047g1511 [Ancylostoma ceylanicum]